MVDCPQCGGSMGLRNGVYKCRRCGLKIAEEELHFISTFGDDDDSMPEGCAACGGDYPNCADSCEMYDD